MSSLPLRSIISGIGIFVALITAVSMPAGFGLMTYWNQTEALSFQARLNAGYVAKYAYQNGSMWTFHKVRLAELIELNKAKGTQARHRIVAASGTVVLEEGRDLAGPTMMRSEPIIVRGMTVGSVEVEMSARPVLINTGLVGLLSVLLGLLIYYPFRILPVRLLDRTVGALQAKSDAALNNMSQGLCMYDAQSRLVVSNARFAEIYELPADAIEPGIHYSQVLEISKAAGHYPDQTVDELYAERQAVIAKGEALSFVQHLLDGRTVAVSHSPMADGGWVRTYEDITERKKVEAQIAHMAHHDALTGLPNRVLFRDEMERALVRVRRGEKLAVLCLDLDHFKSVNDTLGHPIGDALLRAVADRLRGTIRETDTVARLGGDEFAILQVGVDQPSHATALAQRLLDVISAPYDLDGHHVVVGTSVGIAVSPGDSNDADQLLKAADMALYRAKADGRGAYRFFEAEMDAAMQARRALELDLRKALSNREFEIYYQPLVALESNQISGFEALLRWNHPERGRVSPAEFIPLAEEIGLIVQIGEWVLKEACAEAATWPSDVKLAVNLSPAQFKCRTLVLHVASALGKSGLSPNRLELEITETVMLQDTEATVATLHELRALGVRISMDDFGTGYSSLSYLRRFPFDKIKIDRSFINDMDGNNDSAAIVRAVTSLGADLGMSTTAEGVETHAQLDKLRAEGCTEVQGYLFSQPKPASEIGEMLSSGRGGARSRGTA